MKAFSYGIIPYLINDNGVSIMLSKSSKKADYGFVKGKIDSGETPKECAVREVFEEIGVKINIKDLETMVEQKNHRKDIGVFFVNYDKYLKKKIKLAKKELYSVDWFNIQNLPTINKNQSLIVTEIFVKFNKINFYHRKRKK